MSSNRSMSSVRILFTEPYSNLCSGNFFYPALLHNDKVFIFHCMMLDFCVIINIC